MMLRAACLLPLCAFAQSALPTHTVYRAATPVQIDGRLDEAAWFSAPAVRLDAFPWHTQGARHATVVKVLWDAENLYIAHISEDRHITARYTERDGKIPEDDCFEIMLLPDPDKPDVYFNLEWNVLGGLVDNFRPKGPKQPRAPKWDAEGVRIAGTYQGTLNDDSDQDVSWTVEVAIPFRNFAAYAKSTPPKPGDQWRANFNRHGGVTNPQYAQWSAGDTPKPSFHTPHRFGKLIFSSEGAPF